MQIDLHIISAVAFGIALSACCGFRVFVPLLAASVAGYFGWVKLPEDMAWMGSMVSMVCFGTAALVEIGAYYFPFLDNILDTVVTPLAIAAGTLLASALIPLPDNEPLLRWTVALVAGGGAAGTLQASTGLLRLFSTKATLGTGNPLIATGENAAAITGSVFSFVAPIMVAAVLIVTVVWILLAALKRFRSGKSEPL